MRVESTASGKVPPSPLPKGTSAASGNFASLLQDLSPSSISKGESLTFTKPKEDQNHLSALMKILESFSGAKDTLSESDIVSISQPSNGTLEVALTDSGFEKLKKTAEEKQASSPSFSVSISSDKIAISDSPPQPLPAVVPIADSSSQPKRIDPLVLSIEKRSASIDIFTIIFDIDGNGSEEKIQRLGKNDFLLALDKNSNGKIDNGRELFGPSTGDGYRELSLLDSNGDGIINSSDKVFDQLRLLEFSPDGKESLYSLTSKKVESLYLASVHTSEILADNHGLKKGEITEKSEAYIDGKKGSTLQHFDFFT